MYCTRKRTIKITIRLTINNMNNSTQPRNAKGRFKRRSKRFLKLVAIVILIVIAIQNRQSLGNAIATMRNKGTENTQQVSVTLKNSEIDAIQSEASFKARMENQAQQILLQRKIDEKAKQITTLKEEAMQLENQLAEKRKESLSL